MRTTALAIIAALTVALAGCGTTGSIVGTSPTPLPPYVWAPVAGIALTVDREIRDDGRVAASLQVAGHVATGTCGIGAVSAASGQALATDYQSTIDLEPLFVGYDERIEGGTFGAHVALGWLWQATLIEVVSCDLQVTGQLLDALEQILGSQPVGVLQLPPWAPRPTHAGIAYCWDCKGSPSYRLDQVGYRAARAGLR